MVSILTGLVEYAPYAVEVLKKVNARKESEQQLVLLAIIAQQHENLIKRLDNIDSHLKQQDEVLEKLDDVLVVQGSKLDVILKKGHPEH